MPFWQELAKFHTENYLDGLHQDGIGNPPPKLSSDWREQDKQLDPTIITQPSTRRPVSNPPPTLAHSPNPVIPPPPGSLTYLPQQFNRNVSTTDFATPTKPTTQPFINAPIKPPPSQPIPHINEPFHLPQLTSTLQKPIVSAPRRSQRDKSANKRYYNDDVVNLHSTERFTSSDTYDYNHCFLMSLTWDPSTTTSIDCHNFFCLSRSSR